MLNSENLIKLFLSNFPEFEIDFKQHIEDYEEILLHVFFGETLNEKLIELLRDEKIHKDEISKIFNFLEKVAVEGDLDTKEVLTVTILERLGDNKKLLETSYKYMGKNTKIASREIEEFWGRC